MLFCVFMLLNLYAATAHGQDFVCGFGLAGDEVTATSGHPIDFFRGTDPVNTGPVHVLPLLGKLDGTGLLYRIEHDVLYDRDGTNDDDVGADRLSRADLFNPGYDGSLPHFFNEMSKNELLFEVPDRETVAGKVFVSSTIRRTLADYGLSTEADCARPPRNPPIAFCIFKGI